MSSADAICILDIAQSVIQRAVFPHFLVDASAAASPKSLWSQMLRQKLSHVYVCRTWYHAGTPYLYEDICIQQIDQLPLLLRTVREDERIRNLPKRLHFIAYVPNCYIYQTRAQLVELHALCGTLYSFSCPSSCYVPSLDVVPAIPFPPTVTHLHVGERFSPTLLLETLTPLCSSLISLSIVLHPPHEDSVSLTELTLPNLNTLTLILHEQPLDPFSISSIQEIAVKWRLPQLEHLTIQQIYFSAEPVIQFCKMHGSKLTYLAVLPKLYTKAASQIQSLRAMWPLLPDCPLLRHLVFEAELLFVPLDPNSHRDLQPHQNLKWIDIWSSYTGRPGLIGLRHLDTWRCVTADRKIFPALQGVRNISAPLSPFLSLSRDIPPSENMAVLSWPWSNDKFDSNSMPRSASRILSPFPPLSPMKLRSFAFEYLDFKIYCDVGRIYQAEHVWPGVGKRDMEDRTYNPSLDTDSTPEESEVSSEGSDDMDTSPVFIGTASGSGVMGAAASADDDQVSVSSDWSDIASFLLDGRCDAEMELLVDSSRFN